MLIASFNFPAPRIKSQYEAYSFPKADASENVCFLAFTAVEPKEVKLFASAFAALPPDDPVRANCASALVISIRF